MTGESPLATAGRRFGVASSASAAATKWGATQINDPTTRAIAAGRTPGLMMLQKLRLTTAATAKALAIAR